MSEFMDMLRECRICPRNCGVDRLAGQRGVCRASGTVKVALATLHQWEEPCVSGERGSGTVFFSHCNLKCVFCQNFDISQQDFGKEVTIEELAKIFLAQQRRGAHNINLVSATQFLPQVREALLLAKTEGLTIPIVYNTNGYDQVESLRYMEGVIDVYLPDLKYASDELARKYSLAPKYFQHATAAIQEMLRQVGAPQFDENGLIKRGLIIRHMLLPENLADSEKVLEWIKENLPHEVFVSLMAQYTPMYNASLYEELQRGVSKWEYETLLDHFTNIGLENGYVQELSAATSHYTPAFDLRGLDYNS